MKKTFTVEEGHHGLRLDIYLTQVIEDIPSRSFVEKLIDDKRVLVNKLPKIKTNYKVAQGDKIVVDVNPDEWARHDIAPENIPLDIFYEDDDLAIIKKPIGMTVHPAAGGKTGTLVNALVHHFNELSDINGDVRPGIIHRLDRDTSPPPYPPHL